MGLFDFNTSGPMGPMGDPRFMGLMGLASGLAQAAAPSRLPVPLGMAAGQGMQGMIGGYNQGLQNAMALQRFNMLQGLMGGVQPGNSPIRSQH